jgi:serine/threonine protein kinase
MDGYLMTSIVATRTIHDQSIAPSLGITRPPKGQECSASRTARFRDVVITNTVLGAGSTSKVFLGYFGGHEVAVKELIMLQRDLDEAPDHESVMEFENEVSIMSLTQHPRVITFYGKAIEGSTMFMVMELGDRTLADYLNGAACLEFSEQLKLCEEITEGVSYLHSKKIIHRDLKPENILLKGLEVKITDFGLALIKGGKADLETSASDAIIGTAAYVAPEIIQIRKYSPSSDIYAITIIFFEIMTFERSYEDLALSNVHLMERVAAGLRPANPESALCFSEKMQQLIVEAWQGYGDQRPDADRLLWRLNDIRVSEIGEGREAFRTFITPSSDSSLPMRYVKRQARENRIIRDSLKAGENQKKIIDLLDRAQERKAKKDYWEAILILSEIQDLTARSPKHDFIHAWFEISKIEEILYEESFKVTHLWGAHRQLSSLLQRHPSNIQALEARGLIERKIYVAGPVWRGLGEPFFFQSWNKLLEFDPSNVFALENRASLFKYLGDYQKAILDLNTILKIQANNTVVLSARSDVFFEYGRLLDERAQVNDFRKKGNADLDTIRQILATKA